MILFLNILTLIAFIVVTYYCPIFNFGFGLTLLLGWIYLSIKQNKHQVKSYKSINWFENILILCTCLSLVWLFWTRTNVSIYSFSLFSSVFFIGSYFVFTARYQLGSNYDLNVSIHNGHRLITSGIYSLCRHPFYIGLLLIIVSFFSLVPLLWKAYLPFQICLVVFLGYRITVEEPMLLVEFKEEYKKYKKSVPVFPSFKSFRNFITKVPLFKGNRN